jgi:hypothetical protein
MSADRSPEDRPVRDLALYERLISQGIAEADRRRGAVDHVTARRMALVLLSQSQDPDFMRGLIRFACDGAISQPLKKQLRDHARSPGHPGQPQSARLLQYAVARGTDLGPISTDFAALCDQLDRADAMLADLRDRALNATGTRRQSRQAQPDPAIQEPFAIARHDPDTRTVTLILDDTTANMAVHAITISAAEREAHKREVQQSIQAHPENSYARLNRQAIAARETRAAARLRAIERAYRTALDHEAAPPLKPADLLTPADKTTDRELELE